MARYAATIWAPKIARMPDDRRISTLLAFVRAYETIALDDVLDVLDLLITEFAAEAMRLGKQQRLRTLRDLDQAALDLCEICALFLDEQYEDGQLRQIIFSKFPRERVSQAIETVNSLARPKGDNYYQELVSRYQSVRRFLPHLLNTITFQGTPAGKTVIETIEYLKTQEGKRKPILEDAPMGIVSSAWKHLVVDKDGKVSRTAYTLCALERLQDSLRRRDVFVATSERWGDPRAKVLQGHEWETKRLSVCRSLGHPLSADEAIKNLTTQLDTAYRQTIANLPKNEAVGIEMKNGKSMLSLSRLDKLEEPSSLLELRGRVDDLLPRIDLTELLLEIHAQTGFASEFTHASESQARVDDLHISLCAVLLAEACNIGLEPLVKEHIPALTRHRLHWVQQNYIRAETLIRANSRLVDHQATLPLAREWGGGDVASADGLRFVTPVRTLNSGPNKKYFRPNRGITYYNFVSDQFTGFHGIVVPGTLRDSIFILEGLLEQETSLRPTEIMTDTAGASNIIFGLFWLLGYQFSPRLADIGGAKFWRIDKSADYGLLNNLSRHIINPNRIKQDWDDILRIGGSLKMGTIRASELIRSLLKSDRPSSLSRAIADLGRILKTIYMLNYIDDEAYRRRILTQLNRGEGRQGVARIICHGKRGEIRKRYREGQEDQLNALGLVTNTVILWNTIYTQEALNHLRAQNLGVNPEDVARLSPLQSSHVNVLGQYSFTLSGPPTKGKLRHLHNKNA
jgi:TnpA family transposase